MDWDNPPFRVGVPIPFFGVDNNQFKVDSTVYEAIVDPNDGYRSYLDTVEVIDTDLSIFFMSPLDMVRIERLTDNCVQGWRLVSCTDDHEWLRFGTDYMDNYYPFFFFEYQPRSPQEEP